MSNVITPTEARERILHILQIFPAISPSMMNIAMNSVDSRVWKPVLQDMLVDEEVKQKTVFALTPIGRNQSYTVYYNKNFGYEDYCKHTALVEDNDDHANGADTVAALDG